MQTNKLMFFPKTKPERTMGLECIHVCTWRRFNWIIPQTWWPHLWKTPPSRFPPISIDNISKLFHDFQKLLINLLNFMTFVGQENGISQDFHDSGNPAHTHQGPAQSCWQERATFFMSLRHANACTHTGGGDYWRTYLSAPYSCCSVSPFISRSLGLLKASYSHTHTHTLSHRLMSDSLGFPSCSHTQVVGSDN